MYLLPALPSRVKQRERHRQVKNKESLIESSLKQRDPHRQVKNKERALSSSPRGEQSLTGLMPLPADPMIHSPTQRRLTIMYSLPVFDSHSTLCSRCGDPAGVTSLTFQSFHSYAAPLHRLRRVNVPMSLPSRQRRTALLPPRRLLHRLLTLSGTKP
jgi:hypothetical protein